MHFLTVLSIRCVVKPLLSCQIPIVSAADWLTPPPAVSTQLGRCRFGIWIVLTSATTNFSNQKASHFISGSQQWSMIQLIISNSGCSEQVSEELKISSRGMQIGEEGVTYVLDIVSMVGKQRKSIYRLWAVFLIWWHHVGCDSAGKQLA